jgi:hypothetical protein
MSPKEKEPVALQIPPRPIHQPHYVNVQATRRPEGWKPPERPKVLRDRDDEPVLADPAFRSAFVVRLRRLFGALQEMERLADRGPVPPELRALLAAVREAVARYEAGIAAR